MIEKTFARTNPMFAFPAFFWPFVVLNIMFFIGPWYANDFAVAPFFEVLKNDWRAALVLVLPLVFIAWYVLANRYIKKYAESIIVDETGFTIKGRNSGRFEFSQMTWCEITSTTLNFVPKDALFRFRYEGDLKGAYPRGENLIMFEDWRQIAKLISHGYASTRT